MDKAKLWIGVLVCTMLLAGCGEYITSENRAGTEQETTEYIEVGTTVTELERA